MLRASAGPSALRWQAAYGNWMTRVRPQGAAGLQAWPRRAAACHQSGSCRDLTATQASESGQQENARRRCITLSSRRPAPADGAAAIACRGRRRMHRPRPRATPLIQTSRGVSRRLWMSPATDQSWHALMVLTCSISSSQMFLNTSYSVLHDGRRGSSTRDVWKSSKV